LVEEEIVAQAAGGRKLEWRIIDTRTSKDGRFYFLKNYEEGGGGGSILRQGGGEREEHTRQGSKVILEGAAICGGNKQSSFVGGNPLTLESGELFTGYG